MYKPEYGSQICLNKANAPYLSDSINKKEVISNERYRKVVNNCTGLYDVYAGLHISSINQCWRSSISMPISMPIACCRFTSSVIGGYSLSTFSLLTD